MARSQDPHGSDAQFYVNLYDNEPRRPYDSRSGRHSSLTDRTFPMRVYTWLSDGPASLSYRFT